MAALTDNRIRASWCSGVFGRIPVAVKGGVHIFKGALVGVTAAEGLLMPAEVATDLIIMGVADYEVDARTAADGALFGHVSPGRWGDFDSASGLNAVEVNDLGSIVYAVDDNTVSLTDQTGTLSVAGRFIGLDDRGKLILTVGAGF